MTSRSLAIPALLITAATALAQPAILTPVSFPPCCVVPDGHGNDFVVQMGGAMAIKIDASGSVISTLSASSVPDGWQAAAAAVDPHGHLWIAGSYRGSLSQSPNDGFVAEIDSQLTSVLYSRVVGGLDPSGGTMVNAMAIDAFGSVYLAGYTTQPDFPVTVGAFLTKPGPPPQATGGNVFQGRPQFAFVSKLACDPDPLATPPGYRLAYSTLLGGERSPVPTCPAGGTCIYSLPSTSASALAVDAHGIVTVAGSTNAADFPLTKGAYQTQFPCVWSCTTAFVTRLNAQGSALLWSTLLDGPAANDSQRVTPTTVRGVALDTLGNAIVDGITATPNFPVTGGVVEPEFVPPGPGFYADGFVSKLHSSGSHLLFSTFWGGAVANSLSPPRLDTQDNIWLTALVAGKAGLALHADSLVLGTGLLAELAADGSSVLFSEMTPAGVIEQDLALNPDNTVTAIGPTQAIAPGYVPGYVLRQPRGMPSGVSILGVADSAGTAVTGNIAPGEYISIYGTGLGPATGMVATAGPDGIIAGALGGTQVFFDGIPAPILYAAANQLNVLAPFEIAGSAQTHIRIASAAGASQNLQAHVVEAQPYVFVVFNSDGSLNSAANPARPGLRMTLYISGVGTLTPQVPDGTIAWFPPPTPAYPVQAAFKVSGPSQIIGAGGTVVTGEITYCASVPGLPVNMLRMDVLVPNTIGIEEMIIQVGNVSVGCLPCAF